MNGIRQHKWIASLSLVLAVSLGILIYSLAHVDGSTAGSSSSGFQQGGRQGGFSSGGQEGGFQGGRQGGYRQNTAPGAAANGSQSNAGAQNGAGGAQDTATDSRGTVDSQGGAADPQGSSGAGTPGAAADGSQSAAGTQNSASGAQDAATDSLSTASSQSQSGTADPQSGSGSQGAAADSQGAAGLQSQPGGSGSGTASGGPGSSGSSASSGPAGFSGGGADAQGNSGQNPGGANGFSRQGGMNGGFGGRQGGGFGSDGQYGTALAIYAALFAGLLGAAFYYARKGKFVIGESRKGTVVLLLLAAGFCLKLAAAPWISGYRGDIRFFTTWAEAAAKGLGSFYESSSSDYPPLYMYILWATGKLVTLPQIEPYLLMLIKLPSILADAVTAFLLYKAASRFLKGETAVLIAVFYMFNPAVLINSTFWGQVDSFFTMIVAAAIWALCSRKLGWASLFFALAVLMKPQGIIYTPVLLFALLTARSIGPWLKSAVIAAASAVVVALPFTGGRSPMWLYELYTGTVNEYPYASVNGFNLFGLLGANYKASSSTFIIFSYHAWGMIFIVLATLLSGWLYLRSRKAAFASLSALLLIAGVFTFSSSMHERYLFPAAALALLAYSQLKDRRLLWLAFGFSATIFMNTYAVYYGYTSNDGHVGFLMFFSALLNIAMCVLLVKIMLDASRHTAQDAGVGHSIAELPKHA